MPCVFPDSELYLAICNVQCIVNLGYQGLIRHSGYISIRGHFPKKTKKN